MFVIFLTLVYPAFCLADLTGRWSADDGGTYYLRQVGDILYWFGENSYWANVFYGRIEGNRIRGSWADVPKAGKSVQGKGNLSLIINPDSNAFEATEKSGGFGGSKWTRQSPLPAMQGMDEKKNERVAASKIILTFEPGVPDNVNVIVTRGVKEAERFYKDNFGITLPKDLEIVVVPNQAAFAKALQRLCAESPEEAKKHAASSGGTTCPGGIAIPLSKNLDRMFFVAIHELSHKYQGAVSPPGGRERELFWLLEGGATATAGYIADHCGVESLPDLYKEYLGRLRGRRVPPLRDLRTSKGHNAAREKYVGDVVYPKESLAALELARRKGVKSLYNYFLNLKKDKDSGEVFEMTFGIKLDKFEQEFEQWLEKQLADSV